MRGDGHPLIPNRKGHKMAEKSLDKSALDSKYFIDNSVYNCPFCNRRNVIYDLTEDWVFDWSAEKKCYGYIVQCSSCCKKSMHLSYVPFATDETSSMILQKTGCSTGVLRRNVTGI